uniref:Pre-rRNA-processing protein Ipi1 N-terminal domain-containing protein n=1 Tax=Arion vulgaris TaxID=1028688 RepID=A0A0B6Y7H0_9EUPU
MPKSKKKKNQDFQKVKLKVGKKLPKGDNVTNLSFKTRQIQLTQRIKDDGGQDTVTKKKLVIQDLLRQCDHHSSSARVNAISGLKELWLTNYADLMVPTNVHGYGEILKKLSTLLIDNEAIVRHSVINLFKLILTKLSSKTSGDKNSNRLEGRLYSHIHAYLCCAMNHVHEDIKLDALILFDTLLDSFPHLMVQQLETC